MITILVIREILGERVIRTNCCTFILIRRCTVGTGRTDKQADRQTVRNLERQTHKNKETHKQRHRGRQTQ